MSGSKSAQVVENITFKDIAPDRCEVGGRFVRRWLFDHAKNRARCLSGLNDPVFIDMFACDLDHAQDAGGFPLISLHQVRHRTPLPQDDVVGQEHRERGAADDGLGAKHGMARAEWFSLPHKDAFGMRGNDIADHLGDIVLSLVDKGALEFWIGVKMVFDRAFGAPGDEDEFIDPGLESFFDGILDEGLSMIGRSSFGIALVAGRNLVPSPATRKIAFLIGVFLVMKESWKVVFVWEDMRLPEPGRKR